MKTLVSTGLFMTLVATSQVTKVPATSISFPPQSFVAIAVLTPTGMILAQLDPSIVLDTTGGVPVLRVVTPPVPAATVLPQPTSVDVFYLTTSTPIATQFRLTQVVALGTNIQVFRNGLLMAPNIDYTSTVTTVSFTDAQGTAQGDIIQVLYTPVAAKAATP